LVRAAEIGLKFSGDGVAVDLALKFCGDRAPIPLAAQAR